MKIDFIKIEKKNMKSLSNILVVIHFIFLVIIGELLHTHTARAIDLLPSSEVIFYAGSLSASHAEPTVNFVKLLEQTAYNANLKNYIVASGFGGQCTGPCMAPLLQSLIARGDANVFCWYYQKGSNPVTLGTLNVLLYPNTVTHSMEVEAKCFAKVLVKMDEIGKMLLSNITLVLFSLGCHVGGAVGRAIKSLYNQKLNRILACDPNGELFYNPQVYEPLNKDCANQVDVIHTSNSINETMGNADYWVNQWKYVSGFPKDQQVQVECPKKDVLDPFSANSMCSHNFCPQILTQSSTTTFTAGKALNYWNYLAGPITVTSRLGIDSDPNASGNYYVNTSGCPPYTLDKVCENPGADLSQYCQIFT